MSREPIWIFDEQSEEYRYPYGALKVPGEVRLRIRVKRGQSSAVRLVYGYDGHEPKSEQMNYKQITGAYEVYETRLVLEKPGLVWYHFIVCAGDGVIDVSPVREQGIFGYQITAYTQDPECESFDGIIYHIFVDRFNQDGARYVKPGTIVREDRNGCPYYQPDENGIVQNNDFFGGNFDGITQKLEYLEGLGVSCIYLSPVFDAASNHKYDIGDFMKADPAFGGDIAFRRLCKAANSRGIVIMLDGVFNHVGVDSVYFNKYGTYDSVGAYQSMQSPYYDWFKFTNWNREYESWWGIELLPSLNKDNLSYQDFICGEKGVIAHWTKQGVHSWRLDVADELPDVFLDPLCCAIRRENPKAHIIGEVWEDASNKISYDIRRRYLNGGQLNGVTNYPLKNAIINAVKYGQIQNLADTVERQCQNYPATVLNSMMNILGTHDTARILTVLGADKLPDSKPEMEHFSLSCEDRQYGISKLKQASMLQYTLPGTPCVYYGDEAGLEGGADPFNRKCYPWDNQEQQLLEWYRKLAKLRKSYTALRTGKYTLEVARNGVFAFTRSTAAEKLLVAVNVSGSDAELEAKDFNFDLLSDEYREKKVIKSGRCAVYINRPRR